MCSSSRVNTRATKADRMRRDESYAVLVRVRKKERKTKNEKKREEKRKEKRNMQYGTCNTTHVKGKKKTTGNETHITHHSLRLPHNPLCMLPRAPPLRIRHRLPPRLVRVGVVRVDGRGLLLGLRLCLGLGLSGSRGWLCLRLRRGLRLRGARRGRWDVPARSRSGSGPVHRRMSMHGRLRAIRVWVMSRSVSVSLLHLPIPRRRLQRVHRRGLRLSVSLRIPMPMYVLRVHTHRRRHDRNHVHHWLPGWTGWG